MISLLIAVIIVACVLIMWPAYMMYCDPWERFTPGGQASVTLGVILFCAGSLGLIWLGLITLMPG